MASGTPLALLTVGLLDPQRLLKERIGNDETRNSSQHVLWMVINGKLRLRARGARSVGALATCSRDDFGGSGGTGRGSSIVAGESVDDGPAGD